MDIAKDNKVVRIMKSKMSLDAAVIPLDLVSINISRNFANRKKNQKTLKLRLFFVFFLCALSALHNTFKQGKAFSQSIHIQGFKIILLFMYTSLTVHHVAIPKIVGFIFLSRVIKNLNLLLISPLRQACKQSSFFSARSQV